MKRIAQSWVLLAAWLFAGVVLAESAWIDVSVLKAGGEDKSVKVGHEVMKVSFTCRSGKVQINKIIVHSGNQTYSFNVGNKLAKDETQVVTVGDKMQCDSITISDEGPGEYVVRVRK